MSNEKEEAKITNFVRKTTNKVVGLIDEEIKKCDLIPENKRKGAFMAVVSAVSGNTLAAYAMAGDESPEEELKKVFDRYTTDIKELAKIRLEVLNENPLVDILRQLKRVLNKDEE